MATSSREDEIGKAIVDAAFQVHKQLGPGLLEKVYEACLAYELQEKGLIVNRQVPIPITYKKIEFDEGFRLDLLVDNSIIIELKAVEKSNPLYEAQLLSYLRLTNRNLGYLINFNTPLFKQGIQRFTI